MFEGASCSSSYNFLNCFLKIVSYIRNPEVIVTIKFYSTCKNF